tara:strand:+ start:384 stop:716 length:333 start_codon:yes stop_codon:yes gene_type:complete
MSEYINIAVDAMGGDGSPKKIIDGIIHNSKFSKENYYRIYGNKNEILNVLDGKLDQKYYEIINTENSVKSTDSPLEAAKRGKDTSMWLSIESVKKKSQILLSQQVILVRY